MAKIGLNVDIRESYSVYKKMAWLPLHLRRQQHISSHIYRMINEILLQHFTENFTLNISNRSRDGDNCTLYTQKIQVTQGILILRIKNILPLSLTASQSVISFSSAYKNGLIEKLKNDEHDQTKKYDSFDEFYLILSRTKSILFLILQVSYNI